MHPERVVVRREIGRGHAGALPEARAVVAQVVADEVVVFVGAAAPDDAPLLVVDELHRAPANVFDAVDVVPRLRAHTVHAPQLPAPAVINVTYRRAVGRDALRQVEVIVGRGRDVVGVVRGVGVLPGLHVAVRIVGVLGQPGQLVGVTRHRRGDRVVNGTQAVAPAGGTVQVIVPKPVHQRARGIGALQRPDVAVAVIGQRLAL